MAEEMNSFLVFICSATLEGENRRIELKIINIDINLQNFKQLYDEKVEEAQQKIDVTVCLS